MNVHVEKQKTSLTLITKESELHHSIGSPIDGVHPGSKTNRDYLGRYYVLKRLTEFAHLRNVFTANGYPDSLVRSILPGRPTTTNTRSRTVMEGPAPKLLFLPYIAGVSERIERVCYPLGI